MEKISHLIVLAGQYYSNTFTLTVDVNFQINFLTFVNFRHLFSILLLKNSIKFYGIPFPGLCSLSACVDPHILVTTPKTWYEAQSYCRHYYHDLATIDNIGVMERFLRDFEDEYSDGLWTGLWIKTNMSCHWFLGDKHGIFNCVFFGSGRLYILSCLHTRYPLCFDGEGHSFYFWHHTFKCMQTNLAATSITVCYSVVAAGMSTLSYCPFIKLLVL